MPDITAPRNLTHLLILLRGVMPQPKVLLTDSEAAALASRRVASDTDTFTLPTNTGDASA